MPEFNQLVLFPVSKGSRHFVCSVAPNATQKRLAFTGWWGHEKSKSESELLQASPEQQKEFAEKELTILPCTRRSNTDRPRNSKNRGK